MATPTAREMSTGELAMVRERILLRLDTTERGKSEVNDSLLALLDGILIRLERLEG